jgi:hypothetical protein
MIAITADGRTITDPAELKAYMESLLPKRRGRVKKLVAAKREWQSALQEVAAASVSKSKGNEEYEK